MELTEEKRLGAKIPFARTDLSLMKRRGLIQTKVNKFCGAYDHVVNRLMSGIGVKDLVYFCTLFI